MKKSILFIFGLTLLVVGCNKENVDPSFDVPRHLTVDITVNQGPETRAVQTDWEAGNKVYIAFDDFFGAAGSTTAYYLTMTYDGSSWSSEFSDPALEEYLLGRKSGSLAAVYWSDLDPELEYDASLGRIEVKNGEGAPGFYLQAYGAGGAEYSYTVADSKLSATLNLKPWVGQVHFFIDGIDEETAGNYTLNCNLLSSDYVSEFKYYPSFSSVFVEQEHGTLGGPIKGAYYQGGVHFCGGLADDASNVELEYVITLTDNNGTPDNEGDDRVYLLTRTARLKGGDAVKLPSLASDKWGLIVTVIVGF